MKKLAIIGHPTRGKEVISLLEILGGINTHNLYGDESYAYYTIDNDKEIKGGIYVFGDEQLCHFTLEEFLEKFPYKVGNKVKVPYEDGRITENELYEYKILKIKWDYLESTIKYGLPTGNEQCIEYYSTDNLNIWNKKENIEEIKIEIPRGYEFAGVDDDKQQIVFTKIQPKYPKTYEECCKVLGIDTQFCMKYLPHGTFSYNDTLIYNLQALLICRDAYRKLAGEQVGLGKPWEPEKMEMVYSIFYNFREDIIDVSVYNLFDNVILCFPTEEMRDAFYENFKDLIENCKELL